MISLNEPTNNRLLVARSNTSNPLDGFKAVSVTTSNGQFADYPTLGVDQNGLLIGTNNFNAAGTSLLSVGMYTIPKADLLLTTPTAANISSSPTAATGTVGTTLQGINNFNLGQTGAAASGFVGIGGATSLRLTSVTGTGAAGATFGGTSTISVTSYSAPPDGRQPVVAGTSQSTFLMDSLDTRIGGSVYRVGDLLYAVHGTAFTFGTSRAALRVTVLNATTNAVVAETTLGEASMDYYVASIAANTRGDIVVGYTRSGFIASGNAGNTFPSSYASVGTLSGSTLAFGSPVVLRRGLTEFRGSEGGAAGTKRWGDYSATRLDPNDPGIFWTTQEFVSGAAGTASTTWATQATEIIPTVTNEVRWAAAANGSFGTAGSWFNSVVPAAADHAIFSRNGDGSTNFTVTMPGGTTTNDRASVRQGVVTWSIGAGNAYSLTNAGTGTSDVTGAITSPASLAIADFQGTAKLTVSGGGTLNSITTTVAAGLNSEGAGIVSNGSLTVTGAGTTWNNTGSLYLGGNATLAGGTGTLSLLAGGTATIGGTTQIWNNASGITVGAVGAAATLTTGGLTNASGTTPTVSLANASSTLTVNGNFDSTFTGTISGTGSLAKQGSGTFTLGGSNSYTGTTTVTAGVLAAGTPTAFGTNATAIVNAGGTLRVAGNTIMLGSLTGSGTVENANAAATTLTINTTASTTFSGVIQNGAGGGALALAKMGTGTLVLSGTNTFTGATIVSAGTLRVTGSTAVGSSITVSGSGIFGGSGTAAGLLTVGTGGTIAPGNSVGQLSTGAVTFDTSGGYEFEYNKATGGSLVTGTEGDWISSTGSLTFSATTVNPFLINLKYVGVGSAFGGSATTAILASFSSPPTISVVDLTNSFVISGDVLAGSSILSISGNDLVLNFIPAPEPTTVLGFAAVLAFVGTGLRRRANVRLQMAKSTTTTSTAIPTL